MLVKTKKKRIGKQKPSQIKHSKKKKLLFEFILFFYFKIFSQLQNTSEKGVKGSFALGNDDDVKVDFMTLQ